MMPGDRITLGVVALVCVVGAAALLAHGYPCLSGGMAAIGGYAGRVSIREVAP